MTDSSKLAALRESHLFGTLDSSQLDEVVACSDERHAARGELLFLDGEEASGFFVVISGAVKIFKTSKDAKELILHVAESGDSFAEAAVLAGRDYPAAAEALADSHLLHFDKDRFKQLLASRPPISLRIIAALSLKLRFMVRLIEDLTLKDVEERLAGLLIEQCDRNQDREVEVAFSKKVLAAKLGTIPETLSRTLRKLRDAGIVDVDGLHIRVIRPDLLRQLRK